MVWPFASNVPVGCPKDPSFISPRSEREREGEREGEREREREREGERKEREREECMRVRQ
jgi:hypothetical protein